MGGHTWRSGAEGCACESTNPLQTPEGSAAPLSTSAARGGPGVVPAAPSCGHQPSASHAWVRPRRTRELSASPGPRCGGIAAFWGYLEGAGKPRTPSSSSPRPGGHPPPHPPSPPGGPPRALTTEEDEEEAAEAIHGTPALRGS